MMGYSRTKFAARGFDQAQYNKYYHRHQQEYIRRKLRSVKLYAQGKQFKQVASQLSIHWQSVRTYINQYITGGFDLLCQKVKRQQPTRLNKEQMAAFKQILLTKRPNQIGLEGNIWTGNLMKAYLKITYRVAYKSGIYDLLERLKLTHQKAHFDYANAEPIKQKAFIDQLKEDILVADQKTSIVFFDEFSVSERPTCFYGWVQKNTRPKVVSDQKNASASMDC